MIVKGSFILNFFALSFPKQSPLLASGVQAFRCTAGIRNSFDCNCAKRITSLANEQVQLPLHKGFLECTGPRTWAAGGHTRGGGGAEGEGAGRGDT